MKLDAMPPQEVLAALKGVVQVYVMKGQIVARKKPRYRYPGSKQFSARIGQRGDATRARGKREAR